MSHLHSWKWKCIFAILKCYKYLYKIFPNYDSYCMSTSRSAYNMGYGFRRDTAVNAHLFL